MNKRKICACMLLVVLFVTAFGSHWFPANKVEAAQTTVILHYQRSDASYDGWNVWMWPEGGSGKEVKFKAEDDFGKIAVYQTSEDLSKVGFIIRLNEWEDKDCGEDRMIELKDGFAEIWVKSGEEEFSYEPLDGATPYDLEAAKEEQDQNQNSGDTQLTIHYHRYDQNYDGWNLWLWPQGGDGAAYEFTSVDEFGAVGTFSVPGVTAEDSVGFIVKLNEWDAKDFDGDRFVDLSETNEIYLVQGEEKIYFSREEVDLTPKIMSASLDSATEISFQITAPLDFALAETLAMFTLKDEAGNSYEIKDFDVQEQPVRNKAVIIMSEKLALDKTYTLEIQGYGDKLVDMGNVFSSKEFEETYYYDGNDLGANYTKDSTVFKVWAPTASKVCLNLFKDGLEGEAYDVKQMNQEEKGVWSVTVDGDLNGVYYTYSVTVSEKTKETVDLYARTTGANGQRGMVIDLKSTDPEGWDKDVKPEFVNPTDASVWEVHVRDFSIDESSGMVNKGKYLAFTENGTKNSAGLSTGVDYLKELGITHVQLLPVYDYSPNSVDETKLSEAQFNWGYDPYNYNVPEGSYSTDPYHGEVRVKEFKQMIQSLHENDIRVVMDVVYNHTAESDNSYFNRTVPNYFYRYTETGAYSNGSGCGNEVASERAMVSKYIVDSVTYWASEYHIDGFRFDLMGILDIETMMAVKEALNEIDPTIIVYGEGWTGGTCATADVFRALKKNAITYEGVGAFSDDIRDGIKGSVFDDADQGFVSGKVGQEERIKSGVIGATNYSGVDYDKVGTDVNAYWAAAPTQTINYVSCHDNLSLWDKLALSNPEDTKEDRVKMNLLSAAIIYTAQGVPFMQAGEEILRSKPNADGTGFDENSYKSSDATNSIKWDEYTDNQEVFNYYKGLIEFRKAHASLRMTTTAEIEENLTFIEDVPENVVAYTIENKPNGECADAICVIYNANREAATVTIPEGEWQVCIKGNQAGTEVLETVKGGEISVEPISALVLVKGEVKPEESKKSFPWKKVAGVAAGVVVLAGASYVILKGKKKKRK